MSDFLFCVSKKQCSLKREKSYSLWICLGFMIFVSEDNDLGNKQDKGGLHMESVFDFWQDFYQNGRDSALKIRTYGKPKHCDG